MRTMRSIDGRRTEIDGDPEDEPCRPRFRQPRLFRRVLYRQRGWKHFRSWKTRRKTQHKDRLITGYVRETVRFGSPEPCEVCRKPTRRYSIVDWAYLCGQRCERVHDKKFNRRYAQVIARQSEKALHLIDVVYSNPDEEFPF